MAREELGKRIKQRRAELGITQLELALRCGESQQYIGMLEIGERSPTVEVIENIASGLETTVGTLLGEKDFEPPEYEPSMNKLITYVMKLNSDDRDDLVDIAKIMFKRQKR